MPPEKSTNRNIVEASWRQKDIDAICGSLTGVAAGLLIGWLIKWSSNPEIVQYGDLVASLTVFPGSFAIIRGVDHVWSQLLRKKVDNDRE